MKSLLPKSTGDFSKREYWESFFHARKNTFEWYGDFLQHSEFFTKYVKKNDRVLIVGCGNSDLGVMLFDKLNVRDVTNIDISETTIKQMRQKHCSRGDMRPGLCYECMDVFKLKESVETETIKPFSCAIDKGTLDAIHSGENSESDARRMFENIEHALNLMGRYIVLTLAQEHIVQSICEYFVQGSKQWLINCHQLTSNEVDSLRPDEDVFPLPVFGFVMTKLRPTEGLPRVSLFPAHANSPVHLSGEPDSLVEQIRSWVSQEQNFSLLRHDIQSGKQQELCFSCPRTGLTVFRGVLVQSEQGKARAKKNQPSMEGNCTGKIEAIFVVPFGQNDNEAFTDPERRRNLCRLLNVRSFLLVFVNPRFYHTDLDSLKSNLSGVLNAFDVVKAPILSTPDSYTRVAIELPNASTTTSEIQVDQVQFRLSDADELLILKRLISPGTDFRPILATNASILPNGSSVMSPRDMHLLAWFELLSPANCCSRVMCYGLPPVSQSTSDRSRHVRIQTAGLDAGSDIPIREAFSTLYADHSGLLTCPRCGDPVISWSNPVSGDQDEGPYDLILYDPTALCAEKYYACFTADHLSSMSEACSKKLRSQGWLVVLFEQSASEENAFSQEQTSLNLFTRVCSYTVPDPIFADPKTRVDIFQLGAVNTESARAELRQRVSACQSSASERTRTHGEPYSRVYEQLESILKK